MSRAGSTAQSPCIGTSACPPCADRSAYTPCTGPAACSRTECRVPGRCNYHAHPQQSWALAADPSWGSNRGAPRSASVEVPQGSKFRKVCSRPRRFSGCLLNLRAGQLGLDPAHLDDLRPASTPGRSVRAPTPASPSRPTTRDRPILNCASHLSTLALAEIPSPRHATSVAFHVKRREIQHALSQVAGTDRAARETPADLCPHEINPAQHARRRRFT